MDTVSSDDFLCDFRAAQQDVEAGVSLGRASMFNTHWNRWLDFTSSLALEPLLETFQDKVPFLQVFSRRLRTGELSASQRTIKSRSVEDYARSVEQTFLTVGLQDPRLGLNLRLDHRLHRMFRTYAKADPPPDRVKPVPISVVRHILAIALANSLPFSAAVADMIALALFFLL